MNNSIALYQGLHFRSGMCLMQYWISICNSNYIIRHTSRMRFDGHIWDQRKWCHLPIIWVRDARYRTKQANPSEPLIVYFKFFIMLEDSKEFFFFSSNGNWFYLAGRLEFKSMSERAMSMMWEFTFSRHPTYPFY